MLRKQRVFYQNKKGIGDRKYSMTRFTFEAQWLLYIPTYITLNNSTFF